MIYLLLITAAVAVISAVNVALGAALWPTLGAAVLLTVAVIAIDGLFAAAIRRLPARWFRYDRRIFAVGRREAALYRACRVAALDVIVPDLGCFTNFPKKHLLSPGDPAYTGRYLLESAYGIVIHAVNVLDGFLILLLLPDYTWSVALPVALVNALLCLLPMLLLRSNFPRLVRLHRRNLQRTEK